MHCLHWGATIKTTMLLLTGPDVGGDHGPYRQSERTSIYNEYVEKLHAKGAAYLDFCTDEELTQMKEDAEREGRPPIYTGELCLLSCLCLHTEVVQFV